MKSPAHGRLIVRVLFRRDTLLPKLVSVEEIRVLETRATMGDVI